MQRVLEMTLDALLRTWRAVAPWLSEVVSTVPIWAWASLATLLLLLLAVRLLRPTHVAAGAPPDLLLTRVELTATGPASTTYTVDVGFSNLHHQPVQLLRLATVGRRGRPVVREVPAIVAARRAVDLESTTELRPGGRGRLELYAVVPSSPAKAWRIRVPLTWQPFAQRYSGVLLDQSVRAVRRLPTATAIDAVAQHGGPSDPRMERQHFADRPTAQPERETPLAAPASTSADGTAADGNASHTPASHTPASHTAASDGSASHATPSHASPVNATTSPQAGAHPPSQPARPAAQPPIEGLLVAVEEDLSSAKSAKPDRKRHIRADTEMDQNPNVRAPDEDAPTGPRLVTLSGASTRALNGASDPRNEPAPEPTTEREPEATPDAAPTAPAEADDQVTTQPTRTPRLRFPERF